MRLYVAAILSMFVVSALTSGAFAAPGGHFGGPDGDFPAPAKMLKRMTHHLNLDETQRQNLQNVLDAAQPEIDALRERARSNREAMRTLDADDPDHSALINNIAIENGQLATEGTLLHDRVRNEIAAVLTDEQREQLSNARDGMRKRWVNRRNRDRSGDWHSHDHSGTSEEGGEQ